MKKAYIGLGSNIGDRERMLWTAITSLDKHPRLCVTRCSHIYETEPIGYTEQDPFLNMVVQLESELTPHQLFAHMVDIETKLGRTREIRFGPRTIDLDLLLYEGWTSDEEQLLVPHPRMLERAFVLVPLLDVWTGEESAAQKFREALKLLEGKGEVQCWKRTEWPNESVLFAN